MHLFVMYLVGVFITPFFCFLLYDDGDDSLVSLMTLGMMMGD